jgi:hypothetical protein
MFQNGVQISSFIDVTSKSTIAKLRGSFVDQIIKVIIVWIDKIDIFEKHYLTKLQHWIMYMN